MFSSDEPLRFFCHQRHNADSRKRCLRSHDESSIDLASSLHAVLSTILESRMTSSDIRCHSTPGGCPGVFDLKGVQGLGIEIMRHPRDCGVRQPKTDRRHCDNVAGSQYSGRTMQAYPGVSAREWEHAKGLLTARVRVSRRTKSPALAASGECLCASSAPKPACSVRQRANSQ